MFVKFLELVPRHQLRNGIKRVGFLRGELRHRGNVFPADSRELVGNADSFVQRFDGDDEFDTMLGNLAAEGEELTVKVAFNVTAAYDPNAGGGSPITGGSSNIGLWVALFVISTFTLIIQLFLRKREQDEENSQTPKEKVQ